MVASEIVLRNIRESMPSRWKEKAAELQALERSGRPVLLESFLHETGMELSDVYSGNRGWSDLLDAAGIETRAVGPHEEFLRRAVGRLLHVDDEERIDFYRAVATAEGRPRLDALTERQRRLARMLIASLGERVLGKSDSLAAAVDLLWQHAQVRAELGELVGALQKRIDHVHSAIDSHPNVPLQIGGCQGSCVCRSSADRTAGAGRDAREAAEVMEAPTLRSLPAGAGFKPPSSGIG